MSGNVRNQLYYQHQNGVVAPERAQSQPIKNNRCESRSWNAKYLYFGLFFTLLEGCEAIGKVYSDSRQPGEV
jgi:hypothetical protein